MANEELTRRVIEQALDFWIKPEIERRREEGRLPDNFVLTAAQVILDLDTGTEVHLNDEFQIVVRIPAVGPVEKGQVIEVDLAQVEGVQLTDADPNAAHVTIVWSGNQQFLAFDFRHNATRIAQHIEVAQEFLNSASRALANRELYAFTENLFAAVELMAKGMLLEMPLRDLLTSKKHTYIHSKFNWWAGKLGNADPRFAELLNRLNAARGSARYLQRPLMLSEAECERMIGLGEEMFEALQARAPKRAVFD